MITLSRNYYAMEKEELDKIIKDLRIWLWKFAKHEQRPKIIFALGVACSSREILEDKSDPWIKELLDIFV